MLFTLHMAWASVWFPLKILEKFIHIFLWLSFLKAIHIQFLFPLPKRFYYDFYIHPHCPSLHVSFFKNLKCRVPYKRSDQWKYYLWLVQQDLSFAWVLIANSSKWECKKKHKTSAIFSIPILHHEGIVLWMEEKSPERRECINQQTMLCKTFYGMPGEIILYCK